MEPGKKKEQVFTTILRAKPLVRDRSVWYTLLLTLPLPGSTNVIQAPKSLRCF